MSVRGSPPLLQGVSPENSDGAPLYQWIQRGVACSPLPIIYWVLLWVAAPVFDQSLSRENLRDSTNRTRLYLQGWGPESMEKDYLGYE